MTFTKYTIQLASAFAVSGMLLCSADVHAQAPSPEIIDQGAQVYALNCATCHENPEGETPNRARLSMTESPDYLMLSMTGGVMREQAASLSNDQKIAVVAYLLGQLPQAGNDIDMATSLCREPARPLALSGSYWNGWGGNGSRNARFQPDPGLAAADVPKLKLKWAFRVPGGAFTAPTVVGNRLFLPSKAGVVYALDATVGCAYWTAKLGASARAMVSVGPLPSGEFAVYVADRVGDITAFNADTGSVIWRTNIEDHPMVRLTGAPTLADGRLYVPVSSFEERASRRPGYVCCTFRGSLVALNATSGEIIWKTYTIDDPPQPSAGGQHIGPSGVPIWSSPTVDKERGRIYVGTGNAYSSPAPAVSDAVIALDLETGEKRWVSAITPGDVSVMGCLRNPHAACPEDGLGPDYDIGSSPILVTMPDGKDRLIVLSKSGEVIGLDPGDQGRILWRTRASQGGSLGGILWGGASDRGNRVFVSISDLFVKEGADPGLAAYSTITGKSLWRASAPKAACNWEAPWPCSNAFAAAPAAIPGVIFVGSFDGHEYAFAADSGKILWEFDSAEKFHTVNGEDVAGANIYQSGQVVANGTLFLSSGPPWTYASSVLLAFTVGGQ